MSPGTKGKSNLSQVNEQDVLLVHFVLCIVTETRCPRILGLQEETVVEHHITRTINESQSSDQHFATALEGPSAVNRGQEPQSEAVEESRVPKVWFPQGLPVQSKQTL
jgi:hypothetical protein